MQSSSAGTLSTLRGMKKNDATSWQEEKKKNIPHIAWNTVLRTRLALCVFGPACFDPNALTGLLSADRLRGLILFWGQRGKSLPPEEYFRTHTISISRAIEGR